MATFSPDGQSIVAGGFRTDRFLYVFSTARPGRDALTTQRLGKTRRSSDGQKGLVSALAFHGHGSLLAVGTYSPGSIYVYDQRTDGKQQPTGTILNGLCVVGHGRSHSRRKRRFVETQQPSSTSSDKNQDDQQSDWLSTAKIKWFLTRAQGGITQLEFARNHEYLLYSASRRSDAVLVWDLRMLSGHANYQSHPIRGLASFATSSDTNQRLEFDLDNDSSKIYVGGRDKCVRIYDTASGKQMGCIEHLEDASNGVSCHKQMLAVATGSRRFSLEESDNDDEETNQLEDEVPGYLRLYRLSEKSVE